MQSSLVKRLSRRMYTSRASPLLNSMLQSETSDLQQPKLYIYDHCPSCVRARMIFGFKQVPHELIFMANHDEAQPKQLVGKKIAPILQLPAEDNRAFPESMDIVQYVDEHFGDGPILAPASGREDLKKWIEDSAQTFRLLYHPRFHAAPFAEFARFESREYYRVKKEDSIGPFTKALDKTPELVEQANKHLKDLSELFHSSTSVNGSLSYDDIDMFGRLRTLTIVKDLEWPSKLKDYLEYMSKKADVLLLHDMAKM